MQSEDSSNSYNRSSCGPELLPRICFSGYYYLASHALGPWPLHGPLDFTISLPGTLILIAGSVTMWWGERGIEHGKPWKLKAGLIAAILLGTAFIFLESLEWKGQPFSLSSSPFSSLYFTITGFHMLHVVIGLLMLIALTVWAMCGYFDERRHSAVSIDGIYWHFVTVVWFGVFFTFYISPRLR